MKLVSVIIPYFRKKKFFKKTINSVVNQTLKSFEIIIVYDDKDKNDLEFIKNISKLDRRIKIIVNKKNLGAGISRNVGIRKAKGKYIAFVDADDLWKKNKLEYQISHMLKNKVDFSHTDYNIIDEKDYRIGKMKVKKKITYNELLKTCDIGLSTVIAKRKIFKKYLFNNFKTKEDYALWLNLAKNGIQLSGIPFALTSWRKAPNSLSSSIFQKIYDGFKIYYLVEKKNFISSIICIIRLSLNYLIKKYIQKINL